MGAIDKMDCFFDPKFVSQELKIPKVVYIVATFHALPLVARYPIHTFLYVVTFLGTHLGKYFKISPRELWSVASSKQLATNHNSFSSIRRGVYAILSTWDRLFSNFNPAVIYAYHAFDESGRFSTTAQDFKTHMDFIMKTHKPVKLSEIAETIRKGKKFNTPVFAVTFDDGYASILKVSQICKKLNICPTINLISNHDEAVNVDKRTYLSTKDIKGLLKLGWEVGSHTKTHQKLTEVYNGDLVSEISASKEQIEKQVNHKIVTVAYPLGRYNKEVLSVTRTSGFTVGLTMDDSMITKETDPLKLPRVGVDATHTTKEFSYLANPSVVRFRSLLKNSPLKSLFISI
jgi:peptidoglycan/xylan/chitin deacetylase (PgdA/CDA1 family)